MNREEACRNRTNVIPHFKIEGTLIEDIPYGNGHINDTFLLKFKLENGDVQKIILQRINHEIFKQPIEVMENILGVTTYLKKQILEHNGDPDRETLNVILTTEDLPYYKDEGGNYWRAYHFIENTICYEAVESPEDFYASAVAFGHFQKMLANYPAVTLHETIQGFHDTAARFETFQRVLTEDKMGRASSVQAEIQFVLDRKKDAAILGEMQAKGELPLRVTHNDTKLNNIMLDAITKEAICVIDLDTVMPGLAVNDFGDSIRFGASTGAEDEKDLSKIECDLSLFDIYTKGFVEGCGGSLTEKELDSLPLGAKIMTFECGMRFLADYLEGDVYFKIHYEQHNLDRCRTQFKLVADMEQKWAKMQEIVQKYR